jgi:hypothetical protein
VSDGYVSLDELKSSRPIDESRVRDSAEFMRGVAQGYVAALDAAEAAVAAECHHDDSNEWCIYVAAIRALKENL